MCIICSEAGATVSVSPSVISQSSAMVEVTYTKTSGPNKDDWIGVWLLPEDSASIDPKKHAPTKYQVGSRDRAAEHVTIFLLLLLLLLYNARHFDHYLVIFLSGKRHSNDEGDMTMVT